ncbi:MAG TPA: ImcF-related family protein, partial [Myxococcales bacterium]|nr:ImcF-related family protein [Myxococcales bacterium]
GVPGQPAPRPKRQRAANGKLVKPAGPLDEEVTFEQLKRHMLLSLQPTDPLPRQPDDLFPEELKSLAEPMAVDFKRGASVSASEEDIAKDLALLFDIWPRFHDQWKVPRKEELKRKGQGALAGMNRTRRMLELQLRLWAKGKQDLTLTAMVRDGSVFESDKAVRAAFTKEVWKDHAKDALASPPRDDEAWILGAKPQTGEQIQQDMQREYYGQYIREWTALLGSIELRAVRDPNEVQRKLEALTDAAQSPLQDIFERLQDNVILGIPVPRSKPLVPDAQSVTEAFAALAAVRPGTAGTLLKKVLPAAGRERVDLTMYENRLKGFAKALEAAKGDQAAASSVAKTLRAEAGSLTSVLSNQQQGALYESVLEQLWVRPIRKMADALDSGTRQELNFKWCSDVYAPHRAELHGRYPFSRGGSDADLASLVQVYNGKDGKLMEFYKTNLASKIGDRGQDYVRIGGETVMDGLVNYLNRVKVMREALFPNESPEPLVDFTVQLHPPQLPNVQGVHFSVDDQLAKQDTGPVEPPLAMHWPGSPKGPKRALIKIILKGGRPKEIGCRGAEGECTGTFALFRLLEQGTIERKGPRSFTMSWPTELGAEGVTDVKIDFAWSRSVSPWFGREGVRASNNILAVFRDLEPPAAIVPGVESCR